MPGHRIAVSVRIKPCDQPALAPDARGAIVTSDGKLFDRINAVVTGSDQKIAFDAIASPLLDKLRDGYSCTLLAYGQTGSGKTHTMFAPPGALTESSLSESGEECLGIFPRIAFELLNEGGDDCLGGRTLHASAIEVYQDNAYDLLADRAPLQVGTKSVGRQVGGRGAIIANASKEVSAGSQHFGVHPPHCQCMKCFKRQEKEREEREARKNARLDPVNHASKKQQPASSHPPTEKVLKSFVTVGEELVVLTTPQDIMRLARTIELTRTTVGHNLNARSSRSHCLVHLYSVERIGDKVLKKQLLFADLAGSERILKSGVEGVAALQAMANNKSLATLGKVIRALGTNAAHVPYRDSMLTMLLRSSLEGQSSTFVVVNVAADREYSDETLRSLEFGERMAVVKIVRIKVVGQQCLDARKVDALRDELRVLNDGIERLRLDDLDIGIFHDQAIQSEVRSLKNNIRRRDELSNAAKRIRTKVAENAASDADRQQLARDATEVGNLDNIIMMQKTIPVQRGAVQTIWLGPSPEYSTAISRFKEIEDALAFS
mmetsp:Transcript_19487/g.22417  ORF Transcript_19487/g.22417 Transcript_19487/m.22417 type:complete len:547 (-) Transcript_19487:176-1816(-)|eukprot:CAMPEP_0194360752 /NCGR_PEP_ID=MMETSP0174-20130528/8154_1 /TAXON_ID=216777 /ORGANISM="Proboscia alata, Strain PI-D3" /LENGTH=546 /DNA_ID=CAMNT_0039132463 /DNA_START=150 /DNA_END=1790 /DNA_ORIENTATION=-